LSIRRLAFIRAIRGSLSKTNPARSAARKRAIGGHAPGQITGRCPEAHRDDSHVAPGVCAIPRKTDFSACLDASPTKRRCLAHGESHARRGDKKIVRKRGKATERPAHESGDMIAFDLVVGFLVLGILAPVALLFLKEKRSTPFPNGSPDFSADKKGPRNKANMSEPQEEFIDPESSHREPAEALPNLGR